MNSNWSKLFMSKMYFKQKHCSFSNGFACSISCLIPGVNENCNILKWNYRQTNRKWVISMLFSKLDYISWAYYIFNFVQHFTPISFHVFYFTFFFSPFDSHVRLFAHSPNVLFEMFGELLRNIIQKMKSSWTTLPMFPFFVLFYSHFTHLIAASRDVFQFCCTEEVIFFVIDFIEEITTFYVKIIGIARFCVSMSIDIELFYLFIYRNMFYFNFKLHIVTCGSLSITYFNLITHWCIAWNLCYSSFYLLIT